RQRFKANAIEGHPRMLRAARTKIASDGCLQRQVVSRPDHLQADGDLDGLVAFENNIIRRGNASTSNAEINNDALRRRQCFDCGRQQHSRSSPVKYLPLFHIPGNFQKQMRKRLEDNLEHGAEESERRSALKRSAQPRLSGSDGHERAIWSTWS